MGGPSTGLLMSPRMVAGVEWRELSQVPKSSVNMEAWQEIRGWGRRRSLGVGERGRALEEKMFPVGHALAAKGTKRASPHPSGDPPGSP